MRNLPTPEIDGLQAPTRAGRNPILDRHGLTKQRRGRRSTTLTGSHGRDVFYIFDDFVPSVSWARAIGKNVGLLFPN